VTTIKWERLKDALQGNLVLPEDPTYHLLRQPFNQRIDQRPAAIARCVSEQDVVACVRFAADSGVPVTCRSGGHGAEGYCSITDALMIDQSAMQEIRIDTENQVVHVSAGASWGQVDIATYARGLAAPGGGCAAVGVAGLAQGGGFGPIARTWGLTLDNLQSARIVTARELTVIEASPESHDPLFWALRGGGGGNFGAVTQFTFGLYPIGRALMGGMLIYDWTHAMQVFQFFRDWMTSPGADQRLTLLPMFFLGPGNTPMAGISAFYNGEYDDGLAYMKGILAAAGMPDPLNAPIEAALMPGTLPAYTGTESTTAWPGSGQYWRNGYLRNDFPDEAINLFLSRFENCPKPPPGYARPAGGGIYKQDDLTFGYIEPLGGAIGQVDPTDTAFYWRDQLFSFTFIGIYDPSEPDWGHQTKEWADSFRADMTPYFSGGVYVNYMQAELPDWKQAYYGANYDRLRRIKLDYDPGHLFEFPQDVLQ
jgi:FAD binding domain/Berberine and berberine like